MSVINTIIIKARSVKVGIYLIIKLRFEICIDMASN